MKCTPSLFVDMHARHNRGNAIFLSRQPLIILQSRLYSLSLCPSKYQDHSKPLIKQLPINIWSATNTFIWLINLIPVVTSPKLPLMRSKNYPRWRTSHYTSSENISRTKQDIKIGKIS